MTITNNTQHASVYYSVSDKTGVDCGNLSPGDDVVLPSFDDKPDVRVLPIFSTGGENKAGLAAPGPVLV